MISSEYAAGFFDGEGTVYAAVRGANNPKARRASPTVLTAVANTQKAPLLLFQERWAGSITTRAAHGREQELYQWVLAPKNALQFLTDIRPHLIIKAAVADAAIEFYALMNRPAKERMDYTNTVSRGGRLWCSPAVRPEFRDQVTAVHQRIRQLNMKRVPLNARREHSGANIDAPSQREPTP